MLCIKDVKSVATIKDISYDMMEVVTNKFVMNKCCDDSIFLHNSQISSILKQLTLKC
jgi:hypothetical protein